MKSRLQSFKRFSDVRLTLVQSSEERTEKLYQGIVGDCDKKMKAVQVYVCVCVALMEMAMTILNNASTSSSFQSIFILIFALQYLHAIAQYQPQHAAAKATETRQ